MWVIPSKPHLGQYLYFSSAPVNRPANEFLGLTKPVERRRVDRRDARLYGCLNHGDALLIIVIALAKFHRAEGDRRNA